MKVDLFQSVSNRIIEGLQRGVVPWQNPVSGRYPMLPTNLATGKVYSGSNALLLALNDFEAPFYATFNQINQLGGKIREGAKSTEIIYWDIQVTHTESEESISNETYLQLPKEEKANYLVRPYGRLYHVFNVAQTEGLSIPKPPKKLSQNRKIKLCEEVVTNFKDRPEIEFREGVVPCYVPAKDAIRIPGIGSFKNSESFYATLFHELGHATGHHTRLNREGVTEPIEFGSETYSREELVAEITASFLCAHTQIENKVFDNSLSYIDCWISELVNDKYLIVQAASQAQRAFNLIINGGSK